MGDIPFGLFFVLRAQEKPLKTVVISARCSLRLVSQIDEIGQVCRLTRSDILRLLIARARLDDLPQAWHDLSPDERRLLRESR
jgi:hypothetical protein